ncbi:hypothetical protein LCGC14_2344110, partial [marine sediment metagenome]
VEKAIKFGVDMVDNLIMKAPYLVPFAESFQEMTTKYIQNAGDIIILGEKKSFVDGLPDAGIVGFSMGIGGSSVIQGVKTVKTITDKNIKKEPPVELEKDDFEIIEKAATDTEYYEKLTGEFSQMTEEGTLTTEEGTQLKETLDNTIEFINKIPPEFDVEKKNKAYLLIQEKQQLELENEKLDDVFQGKNNERITAINEELTALQPEAVKPEEKPTEEPAKPEVEPKKELEPLAEEARKYESAEEFVDSRRNIHRPPSIESGSRLDDLTNSYGEDIYSEKALQYFGTNESYDKGAIGIINKAKGNPEAEIKVYRTTEKGDPTEILPGDWVSITKQYAIEHGERSLKGAPVLVEKTVKVKDIIGNADSLHEYGYRPEEHRDLTKAQLTEIWNKAQEKPTEPKAEPTEQPITKTTYDFETGRPEMTEKFEYFTKEIEGKTEYFKREKVKVAPPTEEPTVEKPAEPPLEEREAPPTEVKAEAPTFKEHITTGKKEQRGKYQVEKVGDEVRILNIDTGKYVKQTKQNQWAIDQYVDANIENLKSGKRAEIPKGINPAEVYD